MELKLNYEQAKLLREAIATQIRGIDVIEQEDKFIKLEELYDIVSNIEDTLEEQEEE